MGSDRVEGKMGVLRKQSRKIAGKHSSEKNGQKKKIGRGHIFFGCGPPSVLNCMTGYILQSSLAPVRHTRGLHRDRVWMWVALKSGFETLKHSQQSPVYRPASDRSLPGCCPSRQSGTAPRKGGLVLGICCSFDFHRRCGGLFVSYIRLEPKEKSFSGDYLCPRRSSGNLCEVAKPCVMSRRWPWQRGGCPLCTCTHASCTASSRTQASWEQHMLLMLSQVHVFGELWAQIWHAQKYANLQLFARLSRRCEKSRIDLVLTPLWP